MNLAERFAIRDESKAYREGCAACRRGIATQHNPYWGLMWIAWNDGWHDAKADYLVDEEVEGHA